MATYNQLKEFGQRLQSSKWDQLTLGQLQDMVMQMLKVHRIETVTHYLKMLEQLGYVERVLDDYGAPVFRVIKHDRKLTEVKKE